MANQFKDFKSYEVNKTKVVSSDKNNSKNIFRNDSISNEERNYNRIETKKSLKELSEENDRNSRVRFDKRYIKNNRNNKEKYSKSFLRLDKKAKSEEEFKIDKELFPELVEGLKINNNLNNDYVNKVNNSNKNKNDEEGKVLTGWKVLTKNMPKNIVNKNREEISEYYNPNGAYLILKNRELYREELNDILGDMSPYWNMWYLDDLDDYDSENYDDNESESDVEYVEEW